MWFDPAQLMQNADATSATVATTATFAQPPTVNDGKVARVAKVATNPEPIPEYFSIKPTPEQEAAMLKEPQTEQRRQKVIAMLEAAPGTRYALLVTDASTDPVGEIDVIDLFNTAN